MDTTYFGRKYGVMALFDARTKQTLSVDEVAYETNALYFEAVNKLKEKALKFKVLPVICVKVWRICFPIFLFNYANFIKSKTFANT